MADANFLRFNAGARRGFHMLLLLVRVRRLGQGPFLNRFFDFNPASRNTFIFHFHSDISGRLKIAAVRGLALSLPVLHGKDNRRLADDGRHHKLPSILPACPC